MMPATLVITRDVEARYRGYLTSIMLELSPGVYLAPKMSAGVRERTWAVLCEWHGELRRGAIILAWPDGRQPGGMAIQILGDAPKEIVDADGVLLVRRAREGQG